MKNKKESFLKSIFFLMTSQVIIKIFGLIYSMYLINKKGFGDHGNAIYMGGYQIYVLLLTVSSIGVPNAVAKLVAEKIAVNDYKGANNIFKISCICFGIIGFLGTIVLFFEAKNIACKILLIPECEYSLVALSPSVFFVAISSVIRGYFNGIGKISKTAKAQTIEQIFKSFLTISFVELISLYIKDTTVMASIANFASTIAILCSFSYMLKEYLKLMKYQKKFEIKQECFFLEETIVIIKKIFKVSIPITFSAILGTLGKNIDSFTVVRILTPILGEETAKLKYGILSSKVDMLTNMPLAFNIAFATTLVPTISSAIAKKDFDSINRKMYYSLLLALIIAIPSAFGLSLYSKQILYMLFPNASNGAELLKLSSFCIIFMSLSQTLNGALHGIGKTGESIKALLTGAIIKLLLNIFLIPIPYFYEKGAIISNLCSNCVVFIIVWYSTKKNIKLNFGLLNIALKPILATIIMCFTSYSFYLFLEKMLVEDKFALLIAIFFAIIVYIILIFIFKIFSIVNISELLFKNQKGVSAEKTNIQRIDF